MNATLEKRLQKMYDLAMIMLTDDESYDNDARDFSADSIELAKLVVDFVSEGHAIRAQKRGD